MGSCTNCCRDTYRVALVSGVLEHVCTDCNHVEDKTCSPSVPGKEKSSSPTEQSVHP